MATKAAEAQAHPAAAPVEEPVRAAGGRGKLIMIAVVALLLLGAAGGAAWYFTQSEDPDALIAKDKSGQKSKDKDKDKIKDKEKEVSKKPSAFMTLDTFIVNLQDESGTHYLQTAIVLEVADEKTAEVIKAQMPVIRSKLLLLLSSKLPSEIKTPEGKEKLAVEIVTEARKYLNVKSPEQALAQVHFSSFVIQ